MHSFFSRYSHNKPSNGILGFGLIAVVVAGCILAFFSEARHERYTRTSTISAEHSAAK